VPELSLVDGRCTACDVGLGTCVAREQSARALEGQLAYGAASTHPR
jgi:hypothetical protein